MHKLNDIHCLGQPTRFLQLQHATLPYWKRGQGPDLVFFHGWPFDARIWHRLATELEDSFTCHLFDLPGAGLSRVSSATALTLDAHVQASIEAVEALNIESDKFGIIGHNSGGSIARLVAASMPEKITGMVFGNTEVPRRYSKAFRFILSFSHWPGASSLFRLSLNWDHGLSQMPLVGRGRTELHRELVERYFKRLLHNEQALFSAMSLLKSIHLSDFDQLAEAHAKITAPVHLVWGRQDPWFPLRDAKDMLDSFAGKAELTVIESAGLMVHEEVPTEFAAVIRDLWEKLESVLFRPESMTALG